MIIHNPVITGSLQVNGSSVASIESLDSTSGSVAALNNATSSYALISEISGSTTALSSSLEGRISDNETSVSSLNSASSSYALQNSISGSFTSVSESLADRIATAESELGNTLISGSAQIASEISGSFTSTSSSLASELLKNTTDTLTGDLTVTGTITAQDLHVQEVTSSIVYSSGSNIFGNQSSDTHQFTGSLDVIGNAELKGSSNQVGITLNNPEARTYQIFSNGSTGGGGAANGFFAVYDNTASADRLVVDSSGSVGIGTAYPSSSLHVYDSSSSGLNVGAYSAPHYTQSGMAYQIIRATTDNSARALLELHSGNQGTKAHIQAVGSNNTVYFGSLTASNLSIENTGGQLYLNTNGNLGVNTTNVTSKLVVKGTNSAFTSDSAMRVYIDRASDTQVGSLIFSTGGASTSNGWAEIGQTDANGDLYFKANASAASYDTRMVIKGSSGKVGINTDSPAKMLEILYPSYIDKDTSEGILRLVGQSETENSGNYLSAGTAIEFYNKWQGSAAYSVARIAGRGSQTYDGGLQFDVSQNTGAGQTNFINAITILKDAKVGVGTSYPIRLFHVYEDADEWHTTIGGGSGELRIGGQTSNGAVIQAYSPSNSVRDLYLQRDGGSIGIGTNGALAPLHIHTGAAGTGATGSFQDNTALGIESTSDQYIEMITSGGSSGQMQGILFSDNGRNAFVGYKEYTGGVANTKGEALHLSFYDYSASDSNNGIYFGTSTQPWQGVSTTHMFIKGDGNVGINNTSPTARLDVVGNSAGEVILKLQRNGVGSYDYFVSDAGAGGQQLILRANTADSGFIFQPKTSGGANTSAMIIGPDGNVGIGTTAPDYGKLNIWDTTAGSSIRTIADITNGTDVNINFKLTNVGHSSPYAEIASYSTTPLIFQHAQGGNVGIGTTSPIYKLQVQKASASVPAFMIGGAYSGGPRIQTYGLDADANAWMGLGTDMAGFPYEHSVYFPQRTGYDGILTFGSYDGTTYSTKMAIRSSGNVGIGATSPKAQLHIQSGGSYNNADANNRLFIEYSAGSPYILFSSPDARDQGIHFHNTTDNAFVGRIAYQHRSAGDKMWFRVGTSSGDGQVVISSNGNLGIGTSDPNQPIHIQETSDATLLLKSTTSGNGVIYLEGPTRKWGIFAGSNSGDLTIKDETGNNNVVDIGNDNSISINSNKVTLWQEIGPAATEVAFTGAHNAQLTLNPTSIPSTARFVLADVFITADASDHQNFMFSKTSVGSQKNWVNTRGQQPSGQFGTLTGQFITILTYNGESDGYSPNYGMWYANQHLPINSSRQVYINNYGNSNSNGYIYIIVKAFTY